MGGGCLREVVAHGGSTVFETHTFTMAPHNVHLHLTQVYLTKSQFNDRAPAVKKVDNAINWINHYLLLNTIGFPNTYLLDSDLSGG